MTQRRRLRTVRIRILKRKTRNANTVAPDMAKGGEGGAPARAAFRCRAVVRFASAFSLAPAFDGLQCCKHARPNEPLLQKEFER
jgi:hypothetical protein